MIPKPHPPTEEVPICNLWAVEDDERVDDMTMFAMTLVSLRYTRCAWMTHGFGVRSCLLLLADEDLQRAELERCRKAVEAGEKAALEFAHLDVEAKHKHSQFRLLAVAQLVHGMKQNGWELLPDMQTLRKNRPFARSRAKWSRTFSTCKSGRKVAT